MESALLGVVLDSSTVITAERRRLPVPQFIEAIRTAHGEIEISLSPVTVAELVHGIYRAKTPEAGQRRRAYIEELVDLVPVHPATKSKGAAPRRSWRKASTSTEPPRDAESALCENRVPCPK